MQKITLITRFLVKFKNYNRDYFILENIAQSRIEEQFLLHTLKIFKKVPQCNTTYI